MTQPGFPANHSLSLEQLELVSHMHAVVTMVRQLGQEAELLEIIDLLLLDLRHIEINSMQPEKS